MKITKLVNQLRSDGYRITKARRAIAEILIQSSKPLSASDIISRLLIQNIKVNKTTVYRGLQFFLEKKAIKEVQLEQNKTFYESAFLPHHHHLVCNRCGDIEDFSFPYERKILQIVQKQTGFKVKKHLLEFFGFCIKCNH